MIRLVRPLFYFLIFFFFCFQATRAPEAIAGPGGNGVRNGGSGVRCTTGPQTDVLTIERFSTISIAGLGPERLKQVVLERLQQIDPQFTEAVVARLVAHGPARSWMKWSERAPVEAVAPSESPSRGYAREFSEAMDWAVKRFNVSYVHPWGGQVLDVEAHLHLTFDEQLDSALSRSCRLIQLAIFDGDRVFQVDGALESMADVDLAILELHEAIYAVGFLQYGHVSSLLTRKLLTEAIAIGYRASRLGQAVSEFLRYPEARREFEAGASLSRFEGVFVFVGEPRLLDLGCPIATRFHFDGVRALTFDSFEIHRSFSRPEQLPWIVVSSGRLAEPPRMDRCEMKRWEEVQDAN